MLRTNYIATVLVIILGVNLGAWTLSVATNPASSTTPLSIPVSSNAIDAQSEAASVAVPIAAAQVPAAPTDEATPAIPVASSSTSTTTPQ